MPLTITAPHHLEQYRTPGGIAAISTYRTSRQPKPTPSRNPLLRVLQSESPSIAPKAEVMAPKQKKDNSPIPTAASRWKQETLGLLNAKYSRHEVTPFAFDGLRLPDELQQAVQQIAEELANLNNSNDITATFELDVPAGSQMTRFEGFYDNLTQIFRRNSGLDTDSERDSPHVPPIFPQHLRHPSSDVASTTSSDTRESGPEHHTNGSAKEFLKACHKCLQKHLKELAWFPKHYKISPTEKHTMKIRQSNSQNNIVAESDGGLIIYPSSSQKCHFPLLIVESKRMKHRYRKTESVYQRHAAQIYAEMLGQVCHKGLYEANIGGSQESFVIHARYATFYLFYAEFQNTYVRDIVKYGAEYKLCVAESDRHEVTIQQSRPFRMRKPKDNAEFFELISKLLYYIVKGQSQIGYLAPGLWNQYCRAMSESPPILDCINVKPYNKDQIYHESDEILNQDGELDGESDADDDDVGDDHDVEWMDGVSGSVSSSSHGESSDWSSRGASPMSES